MIYFDESATNACDGDPVRVSGPGFVDGNELVMVGSIVCLPGGNPFRSRFHHQLRLPPRHRHSYRRFWDRVASGQLVGVTLPGFDTLTQLSA